MVLNVCICNYLKKLKVTCLSLKKKIKCFRSLILYRFHYISETANWPSDYFFFWPTHLFNLVYATFLNCFKRFNRLSIICIFKLRCLSWFWLLEWPAQCKFLKIWLTQFFLLSIGDWTVEIFSWCTRKAKQ